MQAVSRSTNDRAAEERRELVQEQVQQLVDGAAQGRLLSFCTTIAALNDEASDMSDLKETRTSIKEIVAFMDGSGLLDEAADGLGQS